MIKKKAGKEQTMAPLWKKLMKNVGIEQPTSFLGHVHLGCTQRDCKPNEIIFEQYKQMFGSRISAGAKRSTWRYSGEASRARSCSFSKSDSGGGVAMLSAESLVDAVSLGGRTRA